MVGKGDWRSDGNLVVTMVMAKVGEDSIGDVTMMAIVL